MELSILLMFELPAMKYPTLPAREPAFRIFNTASSGSFLCCTTAFSSRFLPLWGWDPTLGRPFSFSLIPVPRGRLHAMFDGMWRQPPNVAGPFRLLINLWCQLLCHERLRSRQSSMLFIRVMKMVHSHDSWTNYAEYCSANLSSRRSWPCLFLY